MPKSARSRSPGLTGGRCGRDGEHMGRRRHGSALPARAAGPPMAGHVRPGTSGPERQARKRRCSETPVPATPPSRGGSAGRRAGVRTGAKVASEVSRRSVGGVVRLENAGGDAAALGHLVTVLAWPFPNGLGLRSEEHTSEIQSRQYLVCRLLLGKKKNISTNL